MVAVKDAAVTEDGQVPLQQRPELAAIAAEPSQRQQLAAAAALSRAMLQRITHLRRAPRRSRRRRHAAGAPRRTFQRTLVGLVHAHGPLRDDLTTEQAADTYSALANPDLYLLLTRHHGWTPSQYQTWLTDTLQRLLLPAP